MWHSRSIRQVNVLLLLSSVLLAATAGLEKQQEQQQQQLQGSAISLRSTVVKRPGNTTETSPKCKVTGPKSLVPPGIFRCKPSTGVGRPVATAGPAKGRNGGWQLSEEYCYNLDVRLVRAIAAVVVGSGRSGNGSNATLPSRRPITLTELGAGKGCYSVFMAWCGIDILAATDGAEGIAKLTGGAVVTHDLSLPMEAKADWVMSLEVAEHIPKVHEGGFVSNVVSNAKCGVILSWAGKGQAGSGHVNTQDASYVIRLMASHGFDLDLEASCRLQKAAWLPWFKRPNGTNVYRRRALKGTEDCPFNSPPPVAEGAPVTGSCGAVLSRAGGGPSLQSTCYSRTPLRRG